MKIYYPLYTFFLTLIINIPFTHASDFKIQFPVACRVMDDCWITNHVDHDQHQGIVEDYMCGTKATDGNKSTHISLQSLDKVQNNVAVVSAADGIIESAQNIGGYCGYHIKIDHGKGWESSYCHLNPETIVIKTGDTVKQGQIIGAIGMSGQTSWPHLSYGLSRNGMVFDPFMGGADIEGCMAETKPMWVNGYNPLYQPAQLVNIGFNVGDVNASAIKNGAIQNATEISTETPNLSLWGLAMNLQSGDELTLKIFTPDGRILNEDKKIMRRNRAVYPFYFITSKRNDIWNEGKYTGMITITRYVKNRPITIGKKAVVTLKN